MSIMKLDCEERRLIVETGKLIMSNFVVNADTFTYVKQLTLTDLRLLQICVDNDIKELENKRVKEIMNKQLGG